MVAHLIVRLHLRNEKGSENHKGKVIYKCPDGQQFDLGVVQITTDAMDFLRNIRTCNFSSDVKEGIVKVKHIHKVQVRTKKTKFTQLNSTALL